MTKFDKIRINKLGTFGDRIRELRESRQLPLRTVAAYLDIDQAILSRVERGQKNATRQQVVKLAEYFHVEESELIIAWLSDKLLDEVEDEQFALQAIMVAEEKIKYNTQNKK